jgi:hypothetical protein
MVVLNSSKFVDLRSSETVRWGDLPSSSSKLSRRMSYVIIRLFWFGLALWILTSESWKMNLTAL